MKRIILLSLTLFLIFCMVTNVYAASCTLSLKPSAAEVSKGEEFSVDVILKDIDAERGIIAITATLDYDRNLLEYTKMEAQGNWTKPAYNAENGKLVVDRNDEYATTEEVVTKITFKAKENINANDVKIALKDISSSNGIGDIFSEDANTTVKIKNPGSENPGGNTNNTNQDQNKPGNTSNNGSANTGDLNTNKNSSTAINNNQNSNSNKTIKANTSDNLKNGVLPNAGTTSIVLGVILLVIAIALIIYARIRTIDKGTHGNGRW